MPDPTTLFTAERNPLADAGTWMKARQKRTPSSDLLQHYEIKQAELQAYKAQVLNQENQARLEAGLPPIELEIDATEQRSVKRISGACYLAMTALALIALGLIVLFV